MSQRPEREEGRREEEEMLQWAASGGSRRAVKQFERSEELLGQTVFSLHGWQTQTVWGASTSLSDCQHIQPPEVWLKIVSAEKKRRELDQEDTQFQYENKRLIMSQSRERGDVSQSTVWRPFTHGPCWWSDSLPGSQHSDYGAHSSHCQSLRTHTQAHIRCSVYNTMGKCIFVYRWSTEVTTVLPLSERKSCLPFCCEFTIINILYM